jgi:hypothetical protein
VALDHHHQVAPAAVADSVLDQVGEQLAEPDRVAGDDREAPHPELGLGVGGAGVLGDGLDQPAQVDLDRLSSDVQPNSRSAPPFQVTSRPELSVDTIASTAASVTDWNRSYEAARASRTPARWAAKARSKRPCSRTSPSSSGWRLAQARPGRPWPSS